MNRLELGRRLRQELGGMLRMSPLMLAALLLVAVLWGTDSAAVSGLFQSSPVETPVSVTPSATPTLTATPTIIPSRVWTETPGAPQVTGTVPAGETVAPTEAPTEALPTETAVPTATSAPVEPAATEPPVVEEASEAGEGEPTTDENLRYPEGESGLRFEWGMLFDALALFFSYAWLICGILLFLAVPVFLYMLWRASQRRHEGTQQEED